jgi:hypothetical protein
LEPAFQEESAKQKAAAEALKRKEKEAAAAELKRQKEKERADREEAASRESEPSSGDWWANASAEERQEALKDMSHRSGDPRAFGASGLFVRPRSEVREIINGMNPVALDILVSTKFSNVTAADADKDMAVELKVAFLVHGILELSWTDPAKAVRQMQTLANALGAEAMIKVLSSLPADHVLPVTKEGGRLTLFLTPGKAKEQLAVIKVMLAFNAGIFIDVVIPGDNRQFAQDLKSEYDVWAKEIAGKDLRIPDIETRLTVRTEKDYSASRAGGVNANTLLAVMDRGAFNSRLFDGLSSKAMIVDLDYTASEEAYPAAYSGLVKLAQKVNRPQFKTLSDLMPKVAELLQDLPEFVRGQGRIAITDYSLKVTLERVWQEFRAVLQTALSA